VVALVLGFLSCPMEARKLAILEEDVFSDSPHLGKLPSGPSEGPPLYETPPLPPHAIASGPHFGMLRPEPSEGPHFGGLPPSHGSSSGPDFVMLPSRPSMGPP
jgi:hypothetical protein